MRPDELTEVTGLRAPEDGAYETLGGLVMARNPTFSIENLEMEVSIDGKPYIPVAYLIGARGASPLSLSI